MKHKSLLTPALLASIAACFVSSVQAQESTHQTNTPREYKLAVGKKVGSAALVKKLDAAGNQVSAPSTATTPTTH